MSEWFNQPAGHCPLQTSRRLILVNDRMSSEHHLELGIPIVPAALVLRIHPSLLVSVDLDGPQDVGQDSASGQLTL